MKSPTGKGRRKSKSTGVTRPSSTVKSTQGSVVELVPSLLNLKSILVPFDFSNPSEKALAYAIQFAEQFHAGIHLLHVVAPVMYPPDAGFVPIEEPKLLAASKTRLSALAHEVIPPERLSKIEVRIGNPYWEISQCARDLPADLIVIATHGYTGFKHVIMGSTAERVVRHAPCPVLVVRLEERDFVAKGR